MKFERDLLEAAEAATARGRSLNKIDAANIWEQAMDGGRVTPTERRTVEYIVENFRMNEPAKALFKAKLGGDGTGPGTGPRLARKGTSYYKTVDGISYKAELLEDAERRVAANGGTLKFQDLLQLWGKANDGSGITACERRTLQHIGQTHRCEAEASQFLERSLAMDTTPALTDRLIPKAIKDVGGFLWKSLWNRVTGKRESDALQTFAAPAQIEDVAPPAKRQRVMPAESKVPRGAAAASDDDSAPSARSAPSAAGALRDAPSSASRGSLQANLASRGFSAPAQAVGVPRREAGVGKSSSPEANLGPELQQLLLEMSGGDQPMLQLEFPAAPCAPEDAELALQKTKAAEEVERILAARNVAEVLGNGSKEEQRREFKRLALLLHPDKGLVDHDDTRAGLAMRLAMAALNRSRQGA